MKLHVARSGRAGLTLIEVVVSAAILTVIALVMASATIPLSRSSSETGIAMDMDRTAANVMEQLRRELRQTGFQLKLAPRAMFWKTAIGEDPATNLEDSANPSNTITFKIRSGPDPSTGGQADYDAKWSLDITYARVAATDRNGTTFSGVPGTINRYSVQRTQNGLTVDLCHDVMDFVVLRPAAGDTIEVTLTLCRPNPNWGNSSTAPDPIVRKYADKVQFMNKNPSQ